VLNSDGSPDAISRLLRHLVLALDVDCACFFHLPPFSGYQAWQAASADTGHAVTEPSRPLLDVVESIDWDAVISGDGDLQSHGVSSLLLIPVVHNNHGIACLGVEGSTADRTWPCATVNLLGTAALMLGEVLDRRKVENQLRVACDRFDLSGRLSGIGIWDWNITTGELYWSDTVAPLFGLSPDTRPSYEQFLETVHPEDRDGLQDAVCRSVDGNLPYRYEHRIVWPTGEIRWMLEKGALPLIGWVNII